jgi:hypothetical protein
MYILDMNGKYDAGREYKVKYETLLQVLDPILPSRITLGASCKACMLQQILSQLHKECLKNNKECKERGQNLLAESATSKEEMKKVASTSWY